MNPFYQYLEKLLVDHLKKRRVAVWYDTKEEFIPFVDKLPQQCAPVNGISKVSIGYMTVSLARYTGSFFGVKAAVELLVNSDMPDLLLVYIPGAPRDMKGSVLMELEKGGICFEWQLKRLARFCLLEKFSDGIIDTMLAPEKITYKDIVEYLTQENGESPSILKRLFEGTKDNAAIVARWLCDISLDEKLKEKEAVSELYQLINNRMGIDLGTEKTIDEARNKAMRYILVSEFRDDLSCDPPASVGMIPEPQTKEQLHLVQKTAHAMRDNHEDEYVGIASRMEKDLGLLNQHIDPQNLGRVDTFPFEEKILLKWAGELILKGEYTKALLLVSERKRSFWADLTLDRQSQWTASRLMASLGDRIIIARNTLAKAGKTPEQWIEAYCAADGWHRVDLAQQQLEAWIAKMTVDPDSESSLEKVRQTYEDFIQDMAVGFMGVLTQAGWMVSGALHQAEIYSKVVNTEKTPVAYFLVDALRFAMAHELVELLPNAREMAVKPALAAMPTITPVGMAALLPGAESGFNIIESNGKLTPQIEESHLPDVSARLKLLKSRVPDMVDMRLEKLLQMSSKKLRESISESSLLLVRSQEIDVLGEMGGWLIARQIMDNMVGNVARAVRKITDCGITRFVITADHGHLFTRKKEDAFKTDSPGGKIVELHRRCWIGHGGITPPGTVRLSASDIGYNSNLEFVFPKGIGVFKSGGDLGYHHGGLSLQEMIIPVISFKMGQEKLTTGPMGEIILSDVPEKVTNRTFGIKLEISGLFKQASYTVRPLLLSKGVIVGKAGMVLDGDYDQDTGCVTIHPTKKASVAMILENEDCKKVTLIIQDPATDAVLARSKDISVELGTK
jgi:hypothetical protein